MPARTATIASRVGLHARPASIFVEAAADQPLDVTIEMEGGEALDASSILSIMGLGASHGHVVVLRADGDGADESLDALARILETDHDAE
ncbi:HPr family phosphocarrier protein [Arthrobacter monumenti]